MTTEIKPGQTWAWNSHMSTHGAEFTIVDIDDNRIRYRYPTMDYTYSIATSAFRRQAHLVTDPLSDPDDVKPGDVITLTGQRGSQLVDLTVNASYDVTVGRRRVYLSDLYREGWTLTSRQIGTQSVSAAYTPGTVARVTRTTGQTQRMMRTRNPEAALSTAENVWVSEMSQFYEDVDITDVQPLTVLEETSEQVIADAIKDSADAIRLGWIHANGAVRLAKAVLNALKETK